MWGGRGYLQKKKKRERTKLTVGITWRSAKVCHPSGEVEMIQPKSWAEKSLQWEGDAKCCSSHRRMSAFQVTDMHITLRQDCSSTPGRGVHACRPCTHEAEARSRVRHQPEVHSETLPQKICMLLFSSKRVSTISKVWGPSKHRWESTHLCGYFDNSVAT